jgi:hypothetical protein
MDIRLDRLGECRECGDSIESTDQIASSLTNTSDGLRIVRQLWHQACWEKRASKAFRLWAQRFFKLTPLDHPFSAATGWDTPPSAPYRTGQMVSNQLELPHSLLGVELRPFHGPFHEDLRDVLNLRVCGAGRDQGPAQGLNVHSADGAEREAL